ncbi:MAG: hypothetical protein ACK56F_08870 [bacterium]
MAHEDVVAEELVAGRHKLALCFLQLELSIHGAGGEEVAQHVVVAREVPLLDVLQPGHDVVAVAHQVGVVCAAKRRGEEGDHMDSVVE